MKNILTNLYAGIIAAICVSAGAYMVIHGQDGGGYFIFMGLVYSAFVSCWPKTP